jgi:hypothetical protein
VRTARRVVAGQWIFGAVLLAVLAVLLSPPAAAQPDPRQMSGIPLPDPQLPAGTITVRVVRGTLSNNVPDHAVELREGDNIATAVTNAEGRAEFLTLNPGATVVAATELDGVRLESQPFPVPGQGGIRLMLVGGGDPTQADVPAESGTVNFGADSRIVIELGEEVLNVYYLLDIVNWRDVPVEPDTPVVLSLPAGATGATLMGGSSPRAAAAGAQVSVPGPFPPGVTPLRVGFVLPYSGGSLAFDQPLPVALESLLLMVEKWGDMDIASEQIARRADASPEGVDGRTFIFAAGPLVAAGAAVSLEISGLPYHSRLPAMLALGVAFVFLAAGAWGAATPDRSASGAERRRRIESSREKRFRDLVKNEQQHRAGRIGDTKYANRRRELMADLERIYAELDDEVAPILLSPTAAAAGAPPVTSQSSSAG